MEYRQLGKSGLRIPVLSLGTATFGGTNEFFSRWGQTESNEASRMVDVCLDAGLNLFDTADVYSNGAAEEILGKAIAGKRGKVLISTKTTLPMGSGPNERGSSRYHIMQACEASLKRLNIDTIDIYFMHTFDATTPIEETLRALDDLVKQGKIRYIGCSNFSGWHLMKSLAISEKYGLGRYVVYQGYYSMVGRDYEQELMPLGIEEGVGLMAWSPLGWGRLTGKIRRGQPMQEGRIKSGGEVGGPVVEEEYLYNVIDVIDQIAAETEKTVSQIALNWALQRPTVVSLVFGARNEQQLQQNLACLGWKLTPEQMARLDKVSARNTPYPYWHQAGFPDLIPSIIPGNSHDSR